MYSQNNNKGKLFKYTYNKVCMWLINEKSLIILKISGLPVPSDQLTQMTKMIKWKPHYHLLCTI